MRSLLLIAAAVAAVSPPDTAEPDGPIVVEGQRKAPRLEQGEWEVSLSRSYHFGRVVDDQSEMRPMGRDRTWRFCLADVDVEPFIRKLVGEGNTASSGSTSCRPMNIQLEHGKLSASQRCTGGTIVVERGAGDGKRTTPARNTLNVSGTYSASAIALDFMDTREPLSPSVDYIMKPDGRRWSVKGRRLGTCGADQQPDTAE